MSCRNVGHREERSETGFHGCDLVGRAVVGSVMSDSGKLPHDLLTGSDRVGTNVGYGVGTRESEVVIERMALLAIGGSNDVFFHDTKNTRELGISEDHFSFAFREHAIDVVNVRNCAVVHAPSSSIVLEGAAVRRNDLEGKKALVGVFVTAIVRS